MVIVACVSDYFPPASIRPGLIADLLCSEPCGSAVLFCSVARDSLPMVPIGSGGLFIFLDPTELKIFCTRSRFLCLCMCVALLCGKATLSSSDIQASASALVA